MHRSSFLAIVLVALALALAGCAARPDAGGFSPKSLSSVTPTAACPEQEGVRLPEGCAPYDPEQGMALNDLYRQRADLTPEQAAASDAHVDAARTALEELRAAGAWPEDDVRVALEGVGLVDVQTRSGAGDVLFGAVPPEGGCIYGAVEADQVTVDAGGYIMDGGYLPAQ